MKRLMMAGVAFLLAPAAVNAWKAAGEAQPSRLEALAHAKYRWPRVAELRGDIRVHRVAPRFKFRGVDEQELWRRINREGYRFPNPDPTVVNDPAMPVESQGIQPRQEWQLLEMMPMNSSRLAVVATACVLGR